MNSSGTDFEATKLRQHILNMAYAGGSVHIACAFSIVEILAVLYRDFLRYPGNDPDAVGRDYLVLSKGHGVMAQYACMRELEWLTDHDLATYFGDGTHLKGLSDSRIRGLEVSSGSLGHGFSVGVGLAFAAARCDTDQRTFAVVGDGEINEGAIWEGCLFAAHHNLDKFMIIVDENQFQAMGRTQDVLSLGSLAAKLDAFGFDVVSLDGHDETALTNSIAGLLSNGTGRPKAVVARTVKGRGVDFMEHDNAWHYTRLTRETWERARTAVGGDTP